MSQPTSNYLSQTTHTMNQGKLYKLRSSDNNWPIYASMLDAFAAINNSWAKIPVDRVLTSEDIIMPFGPMNSHEEEGDGCYYRVILAGSGIIGWIYLSVDELEEYWMEVTSAD